jgi:hypothetical protein
VPRIRISHTCSPTMNSASMGTFRPIHSAPELRVNGSIRQF